MPHLTQNELQRDVSARIRAVEPRIRQAIAGLSPSQIAWKPPEGGWSIAQVFEHLCVTDEANLPVWERLIRNPAAARKQSNDVPWKPRLGGRLVVGGLTSPRKAKTPPKFRIGEQVRSGVVEQLFSYIRRVLGLIEESAQLDWMKLKHGSVALPILRYNIGDAWLIEAVHLERHAAQIERIRGHAQFPQP